MLVNYSICSEHHYFVKQEISCCFNYSKKCYVFTTILVALIRALMCDLYVVILCKCKFNFLSLLRDINNIFVFYNCCFIGWIFCILYFTVIVT